MRSIDVVLAPISRRDNAESGEASNIDRPAVRDAPHRDEAMYHTITAQRHPKFLGCKASGDGNSSPEAKRQRQNLVPAVRRPIRSLEQPGRLNLPKRRVHLIRAQNNIPGAPCDP